jgi:cytochrome c peroxidase
VSRAGRTLAAATWALAAAAMSGCPRAGEGTPEVSEAANEEDVGDAGRGELAAEAPADAAVAAVELEFDAAFPEVVLPPARRIAAPPLGLPATPSPAENPTTAEKAALGELLFFEPRLSGSGAMSCADCHDPAKGFADGQRRSRTARGTLNQRHTPSLLNTAYASAWFWDGSADTLEGAIDSNWRGQMAPEPFAVAAELHAEPTYRAHFERAFRDLASPDRISEALAAYLRTLRSGDAPWDRFEAGAPDAVSEAAVRGFRLFSGRAQCAVCHPPPLYTDRRFHHVAARAPDSPQDPGRYRITGAPHDREALRTPSLRGLVHTAPYFHDGSAETLEDAVRVMSSGGRGGRARDLEPSRLTDDEIADLVAFLRALSPAIQPYEPPELP